MSAKQLYRVNVSFDMYVLADNKDNAEDVANDHACADIARRGVDLWAEPLNRKPRFADKRADAQPWGADEGDDRTVAQILAEQAKASAA